MYCEIIHFCWVNGITESLVIKKAFEILTSWEQYGPRSGHLISGSKLFAIEAFKMQQQGNLVDDSSEKLH